MNSQLHFIRPYLRGWTIIVGSMVLAYLMASNYLSYVSPMYESTAKLRLADHNEGVPNSNLYKDLDVFANTQKIQAEIELLQSHALLKKALQKLPFAQVIQRVGSLKKTELFPDAPITISFVAMDARHYNKPFLVSVKADSTYTVVAPNAEQKSGRLTDTLTLGETKLVVCLNKTLLDAKKDAQWSDQYEVTIHSEDRLLAEVLRNLDVTSVDKDVPVIRISYKCGHPEKAAQFPNALAEAYIEDYIETKFGAANLTSGFLEGRIKEISGKLSEAELAILNYREAKGITNLRQETETDLRKISQLQIQQTNLKMNLDAIRELEYYVEKGKGDFLDLAPNFEAFTDLLSTEMIKKIKQLQAEKRDLLLEYTPKDDRVKVVDEKIADLTSYLTESIKNTRKNLQTKYDNLLDDISVAEQTFIPVPEKERVMAILNREFDIYQQSYNFLNQKQIEAEIAKAAKMAFHRIITPASVSKTPVSPNYAIIKGVSVILGLIAAIILIFTVHSLKARVNSADTIVTDSSIPIAATVPKLKNPAQTQNHFIRMLTQWQVKNMLQPRGILCFTGFSPAQGQTFISTHVINTLKIQGKKIGVITLKNDTHFTHYHQITLENDHETHIDLFTDAMKQVPVEQVQQMIQEQSQRFDQTILINSIFNENFTLAMMQVATLNLICVDTRLTPAKCIAAADLVVQEYQIPAPFFVLNRDGYNPGFIRSVIRKIQKTYFLKNPKNAVSHDHKS